MTNKEQKARLEFCEETFQLNHSWSSYIVTHEETELELHYPLDIDIQILKGLLENSFFPCKSNSLTKREARLIKSIIAFFVEEVKRFTTLEDFFDKELLKEVDEDFYQTFESISEKLEGLINE